MRKYLLGILLIFVFLQPVASRVIVYFNAHSTTTNIERSFLFKKQTPSTSTLMEALATEEDDEDERVDSETKHNESNLIFENQIQFHQLCQLATKVFGLCIEAPNGIRNQSLYILWSVFRI